MDERVKILEMVKEGKVTPEQAVELLSAIEGRDGGTIVDNFVDIHDDQGPARRLRIIGLSGKGSQSYFDIPLSVIKFFNGLFPNSFKMNFNNIDLDRDQLMDRIYSGRKGIIHREAGDSGGEVVIKLI